ncbi:hypothetical protein GN956_G19635 [Arapaima gigas]
MSVGQLWDGSHFLAFQSSTFLARGNQGSVECGAYKRCEDPAAVPADVSCGEEARLPSASRDCEEDPLTLQTVSTPLAHLTVANEGS